MLIFVKPLVGPTIRLKIEKDDTIESIKEKLRGETRLPLSCFKLTFRGKCLDPRTTAVQYGINEESMLTIILKPCKSEFIEWDTSATAWNAVCSGLNLEGICNNKSCRARGQLVTIRIGFGICNLFNDCMEKKLVRCPMCSTLVTSSAYILSNCWWIQEGQKTWQCVGDGWVRVVSEKPITVVPCVTNWDQKRRGKEDWKTNNKLILNFLKKSKIW